MLSIFLESEG